MERLLCLAVLSWHFSEVLSLSHCTSADFGQVAGDRAGWVTLAQRQLLTVVGGWQELEAAVPEQSSPVTGSDLSPPRLCHVCSSLGNACPEMSRRNFPHKEVTAAEQSPCSG